MYCKTETRIRAKAGKENAGRKKKKSDKCTCESKDTNVGIHVDIVITVLFFGRMRKYE